MEPSQKRARISPNEAKEQEEEEEEELDHSKGHPQQMYAILGLKEQKLELCPILSSEVGRFNIVKDKKRFTIDVGDDDSISLGQIPDFEHRGLDLCGYVLGAASEVMIVYRQSEDKTKVSTLRKRLADMNFRQREVDSIAFCVARTLVPLCNEIWDGDTFGHDGTQISLTTNGSCTKVSGSFAHKHTFEPYEIHWLTETQAKIVHAFTKFRDQWLNDHIWMPDIEFIYSRTCLIWRRWIQVTVSARQESKVYDCPRNLRSWNHESSFRIYETKNGKLGWRFTRAPLPWDYPMPSAVKGKTTWDVGFPPLQSPSFNMDAEIQKIYNARYAMDFDPREEEQPRSAYDRSLLEDTG